jgi:hypothetical protein
MKISKSEIDSDMAVLSKFIRVKEVSDILGVTRNTSYARAKAGVLTTVTLTDDMGETLLFYRSQVLAVARGEV